MNVDTRNYKAQQDVERQEHGLGDIHRVRGFGKFSGVNIISPMPSQDPIQNIKK